MAGIALVVTIVPRPGPGPSPFPTTRPTPAPSLDEHVVLTDQGAVSFHFEDGAIVIRLTEGGATTELGRALVATEVPSPGASPVPAGTALFAMLCGPAEAPDAHRYVFGHIRSGAAVQYSGPPAVGQGAIDGLFLFALQPGPIAGAPAIQVKAGKTGPAGGFPSSVFSELVSDGEAQPSGCYVGG